ncbi:MAG TPA: hypothetical protein VFR25_01565 [Candidatus Eisenbacteria bacterium]|nr:hypothetical protein [Candidatus Eisenbacteria bacterium]
MTAASIRRVLGAAALGLATLLAVAGCQDTIVKYLGPENKPDLYIATDTTRYEAHDLDNVTDVEAWTWPHTGRIANVYHRNFVHHGHARITIEDANGKVVYDHIPVEYSLVNETQDGEPGDWRVMIELFGAKGRVDFSVSKKR